MKQKLLVLAAVVFAIGLGTLTSASTIGRVLADGGGAPDTTCSSTGGCVSYANSSSGPGVASSSVKGSGLTGSTTLVGTKTTNAAGVLGTDSSPSGSLDAGVKGVSKSGTGVTGTSTSGNGVKGVSAKGNGVIGTSNAGNLLSGVSGTSTNATGVGVTGTSPFVGIIGTGAVGVDAIKANNGAALQVTGGGQGGSLIIGRVGFNTPFTIDESGNFTTGGNVQSKTVNGGGVFGQAPTGVNYGSVDGFNQDPNSPYASVEADTSNANGTLFDGFDANFDTVYALDTSGNIRIAGQIFTAGTCNSGCIAGGHVAKRVVSYTPRESQPTMEDLGSAQLTNGRAHVALDGSFGNVIDRSTSYLVFLTPDGDCKGLFVADKTPTGFDVAELRGGRSTIAFDYRIVARPFGDHSTRLPMISPNASVRPSVFRRVHH
ncbi:MAG TPA: hypothetical protein VKT51_03950 [Candidatus Eremiobacteraceae bacterium]|nr:hypothetical protein [Candidatus Eremiobacteraceae bacterium]